MIFSDKNRFDSYLTTSKLPWKKSKKPLSLEEIEKKKVASFELWVKEKDELNNLRYVKQWSYPFLNQAICVSYCKELDLFAAGIDDGCVMLVECDLDRPERHKMVFCKKIHKKRVMKVWFIPQKNLMFSIGEDKYLIVTNLNSQMTQSGKG